MDRELLIEIGCEELPAGWLPGLTQQVGEVVSAQLRQHRLAPESPADTYSTPRRLTVRVARLAERQTDLEELVNGPPLSASLAPDGRPTPAAIGFASKQGVEVEALERVETAKGIYLAYRRRQRGKAAVDVLPAVLGGTLRGMAFPKQMHWDATLDDGRGELTFGRPIRWILFLYGGRVVPFTITRSSAAQTSQVQEITSGAVTYGHRFLTTSGRAGRAIKVRSFDEYRARLLENFVILERSERHNKIARELDAKAQRLQGRVSRVVKGEAGLLQEVPDLVEYPSVVAGTFALEFLELPEEVLRTALIHHQHYFPLEAEDGRLKNAFLAVINTEPDNERTIARGAEHVVAARLRDAQFFWDVDRSTTLDSRIARLGTLLFHQKLGSYQEKSLRLSALAGRIAREAFGADEQAASLAALAGRLAKSDLATDMVREFTELQGSMGGVYAREEGQPEAVWKAIYYHYLPLAVEEDASPTRAQLGAAAVTWAAVSLADKLDTVVGLFAAGERPTGSRDPFGLRRAGHGVIKILVDLSAVCGVETRPTLGRLIELAREPFLPMVAAGQEEQTRQQLLSFFADRLRHVMQVRGLQAEEIQAVTARPEQIERVSPADLIERARELGASRSTPVFASASAAFKRANNIVSEAWSGGGREWGWNRERLTEPAELSLRRALDRLGVDLRHALDARLPARAVAAIAAIEPDLGRFFSEVRVMVDDDAVKEARLALLAELRDRVSEFGDISALAPKQS